MKFNRIDWCCLLASAVICQPVRACPEDLVTRVRGALSDVAAALPQGRRRTADYLYEFGYKYKSNPHYQTLAVIVSNNLVAVNSNFNACATNELDKLLLLSTAWAFDGAYFLNSLSNDLNLVEQGILSKREFLWARRGSRNVHLLGLIPMEYDSQGVSNLVLRMQHLIGETNYCQRILSGAAKSDVIDVMNSMSDGADE